MRGINCSALAQGDSVTQRMAFCGLLAVLIGSILVSGCRPRPSARPPRPTTTSITTLDRNTAVLRRAQSRALGSAVEVKTYLPPKMYEAIDGEADLFLSYDCRGLVVGKYRAGKMMVSAEVFDQVEPINAFGVFSQLRGEAPRVTVGAGAVQIAQEAVLFWKSRFFVRVSITSAERPPLAALVDLSRSIAAEIEGPSALPTWTTALPPAATRQQYVARNVLGHGFLTRGMIGEYRIGTATCRVVLARASGEAEARDWSRRLRDFYHGAGGGASAGALPSDAFQGTDPQGQTLWAACSGRYVAIAAGDCSQDKMRQLLSATLSRLESPGASRSNR